MFPLLRLPLELTVKILLHLDVPDAYAIQAVNHSLRDIYNSSVQLQYALECKVAQVRDNPNCHLPIGKRLEMLRRRETAWRSMTPTSSQIIPLPEDATHYNKIERNLYIGGKRKCDGLYSLTIEGSGDHSFRPIQADGLVVTFQCCIDENDLIACFTRTTCLDSYFEFKIELLQHSTGLAHPLAAKPTIVVYREVCESPFDAPPKITMEIFGENLVFVLNVGDGREHDYPARLYVLNWKTGGTIYPPMSVFACNDIVVLDKDLFLLLDNKGWLLRIYHIPPSPVNEPLTPIQQLRLPAVRAQAAPTWYHCRSIPNPTGDGDFPRHVPSSVPFMNQPETALIEFQWNFDSKFLIMLVHRHSIMNLLPSRSDWSTITEPQTTDWEVWGPPITLWDETQMPMVPTTDINGQRWVRFTGENGDLFLFDFNKYNAKRFSIENPRTLVTNNLPFTKVDCRAMTTDFGRLSIGDSIIVRMKSNNSGVDNDDDNQDQDQDDDEGEYEDEDDDEDQDQDQDDSEDYYEDEDDEDEDAIEVFYFD